MPQPQAAVKSKSRRMQLKASAGLQGHIDRTPQAAAPVDKAGVS